MIQKGLKLVKLEKYFTIWAPRQTGKSTYFTLLAGALEQQGYKVARINFESYMNAPISSFLERFVGEINKFWNTSLQKTNISNDFICNRTNKRSKISF